jgi:hypothetical protein
LQVAASDVPGKVEFFDVSWFSAGSFVKHHTLASELQLESVDLLKLDVEGHELPALRGARSALDRFKPTAVIEMNLFTTTSVGNTLPFDFLGEIRSTFPYVYDFDVEDGLLPIVDKHDMYKVVQRQFLSGRPSDLICRFEPLSDERQKELSRRTRPRPPERHALENELATLREQLASASAREQLASASAREQLASIQAALDEALHENHDLRASTSWTVTAPARWISSHLGRLAR